MQIGFDIVDEVLQAELDAIRPLANKPCIEQDDWHSTSERIICETIAEFQGRDSRVLNLSLLCRFPFALEQTEAKTIWYQELRRQTGLAELPDAEFQRPVKSILPRDEWSGTVQAVLRETIELYSPYSRQNPGQWSEDTKKLEAFFLELKRRLPFEMDPDELPVERQATTAEQQDLATYHRDFQTVWYQECAAVLKFQSPKPPATTPAVESPAQAREKQMTLF